MRVCLKRRTTRVTRRFAGVLCAALFLGLTPSLARSSELQTGVVFLNPMGANVAVQNQILEQMQQAGVRMIRTDVRPTEPYIDFAKRAYARGIKIDAIFDLQYRPARARSPASWRRPPPLTRR